MSAPDTPSANDNGDPTLVCLDRLARAVGNYRTRVHETRFDVPFPLPERKAELIDMAEQVIGLQPATMSPDMSEPGRLLRHMLERQVGGGNKVAGGGNKVAGAGLDYPKTFADSLIRARRAVMPTRITHAPEKFLRINRESREPIAYWREFVAAYDHDAAADPSFVAEFSSLGKYRDHAAAMLALHDFAGEVRKAVQPYLPDGVEKFAAEKTQIARTLNSRARQFLEGFPNVQDVPERYLKPYTDAHFSLAQMGQVLESSHPKDIGRFAEQVDYIACGQAFKAVEAIGNAYPEDYKRWSHEKKSARERGEPYTDPRTREGDFIQLLARARWSRAADEVVELWKGNARILGNPDIEPHLPLS